MCEMLGISAKRRLSANGILRTFFSHAEQHPHGWGLATFPDGEAPAIEKEPICATGSTYLKGLLEMPIEERTLIAHIRLATVGHLEYENCHPFTATDNRGRIWTLAHNGTIFNSPELNDYISIQYGDTDSERVLLHLIDRIDREQIRLGRSLDEEERFGILAAVIAELSKGKTAFIVTHRLASVKIADRIIMMKDGKALEIGTHRELMELDGEYKKMYDSQSQWYLEETK